jgi:hypothetical protein
VKIPTGNYRARLRFRVLDLWSTANRDSGIETLALLCKLAQRQYRRLEFRSWRINPKRRAGRTWTVEESIRGGVARPLFTQRLDERRGGLTGDYEVTYRKESEPDELRAYREKRRRRGKRVEELGEDKISDHLVVIFGAELSARAAVATLEALIDRIREEGLIIGRVRDGDLTWETTDPSPRLIKR